MESANHTDISSFSSEIERKDLAARAIQRNWKIHRMRRDFSIRCLSHKKEVDFSVPEKAVETFEKLLNWFQRFPDSRRDNSPKAIQAGQRIFFTALKIKELYQKTHYTFTHSHSHEFLMIFYLITELTRALSEAEIDYFTMIFRMPNTNSYRNIHEFIEMQKGTKAKMNDHEYSKELISIDGDLYNTIDNESSLSFLYKNSGIIADHERVLLKIIQSLGFSEEIHSLIYDKLCSLFPPKQGIGVIQVISIPKYIIENEATNPIYRAHPFGRYCECSPNSSVEILRTVQENYRPFIVEQHKESRQVLQWRILSNFGDFPGVRVHTLTPFAESKSFKEPLKLLIKEILIYKDLWNINALSEKDVDDIRARIIRLQLNQVHFSLEIVNLIGLQLGKDLSSFFVNLK